MLFLLFSKVEISVINNYISEESGKQMLKTQIIQITKMYFVVVQNL